LFLAPLNPVQVLHRKKRIRKLKKIILLALVAFVAWGYYIKNGGSFNVMPTIVENSESASAARNSQNYRCDGRQRCSQMGSYEEAKYFIENCPNTKMDGDRDGIPCERQFGR
jgi:Excalibur calcium-binding domain